MKTYFLSALLLCTAAVLTGCKSQESAYKQAYEKAKAQEQSGANEATTRVTVQEQPAEQKVVVTPVTVAPSAADNSDVRTIPGGVTVVNGEQLRAYSVVVGSFVTQTNAETLMETLKAKGYAARVVKTNETINGHTGWYRVIASSYDDKASAVQSRTELISSYQGAWLLYNK